MWVGYGSQSVCVSAQGLTLNNHCSNDIHSWLSNFSDGCPDMSTIVLRCFGWRLVTRFL